MVTTALTTPTTVSTARARASRVAVLFAAAGAVVAAATTAIALAAVAAGADPAFSPIQPLVYLPFALGGLAAAIGGWAIVRARAPHPARLLRVLVPALTVLSFAPDVLLAVRGFIPGTTVTGVVALMLMHVVVVTVAVPVLRRALPVS